MSYFNRRRPRRGLSGLGDYSDSDQCSSIPIGDPYRRPGNYCSTPDGGMTTFNSDGSTYRAPGASVDPDPAHPAGSSGGAGGFFDALINSMKPVISGGSPMTPAPSSGISTTTALAIGGGALLLVLLIARRGD
jgi:hypothetical protein